MSPDDRNRDAKKRLLTFTAIEYGSSPEVAEADGEIQQPRDQATEADATWLPRRTPEVEEAFTKDEDGTIYI